MNQTELSLRYLFLSGTGALLIIALLFFGHSNANSAHLSGKLVVGGAFIICCVCGISVALKPDRINKFQERGNMDRQRIDMNMRGHHPECEHFRSHTIKFKNEILCSGCSGLALGSIISIFLMIIYIVFLEEITPAALYLFIIPGMVLIALNYVETLFPTKSCLHMISNVLLIISFFFIITGTFHLTGRPVYGIFAILISFIWLDTRIQLSRQHHSGICMNCSESCKAY